MSRFQLGRLMALAIGTASLMCGSAWGQTYTLEWFDTNNSFISSSSTINVTAGTPLVLNLYIHETGGTTLQTDTLFAFGMRTTYGTTGVLSVASTNSPDMVNNPQFDTRTTDDTNASYAELGAAAFATNPGIASDVNGRIFLGTFRYQTAVGITTLTVGDIPATSDWIYGTSATDFDGLIDPSQITVNVNPVPEPSTVLLIGAGCLGLCRVIVRRRKAAAAPILAA
jgi:hypothetical protein